MEHGDIMSKTPYELIGQKALYQMIDHFYQLVEKDSRINHLFPGDSKKPVESRSNFDTVSWVLTYIPKNMVIHVKTKTYGIYN